MAERQARLGILAGGGKLPLEIANSARSRGLDVSVVAIDGEADADFGAMPVTRVNWGQIGGMIRALKRAGIADLVIVGRVTRPELKALRPDLGFLRNLPAIVRIVASGGDDSVLRRVVKFFERQGLRVVGPGEAAPELVLQEGPIGSARSSASDQVDIRKGMQLVRALGPFDIGQSVIVADGRIVAIEGAEGTDRMIARARTAQAENPSAAERRGVLVKRSKPGQDLRVDMPAIGPHTVSGAERAGLRGIAAEAGKVLVAERADTLVRADAAELFVEGVRDPEDVARASRRFDPRTSSMTFRQLGRTAPRSHAALDAIKAVSTQDVLADFGCGRAAVVTRKHVLAVEAGEGVAATLERAAGLRQWASVTRSRRGVAAFRSAADLTREVVRTAARAGYAGIVIANETDTKRDALEPVIAEADREGLFVLLRQRVHGATV